VKSSIRTRGPLAQSNVEHVATGEASATVMTKASAAGRQT